MLSAETPRTVRVHVKLTQNQVPPTDLHIEVDDLTSPGYRPVAAFTSLKAAANWLTEQGYTYAIGTNGVWGRT